MTSMKVVLVDDERLALLQLKKFLEIEIGGTEVIGMFLNPVEAANEVRRMKPDVVFMDIQMPEIDGLQLGSKLQEQIANLELVFVTAHDQYALEAFELNAVDYIKKPIQLERISKTVTRLRKRLAQTRNITDNTQPGEEESRLIINSLQKLSFNLPGADKPILIKWRTSKAQELFAYLLHNRGKTVARETITELLWPNFESQRAVQQLYTTIYQIRQALKANGLQMIITSEGFEGGYTLDLGSAIVDVDEWEKQLKELGAPSVATLADYRRLLEAYQGSYLEAYGYIWAEYERERIRRQWVHIAMSIGELYAELQQEDDAMAVYALLQQLMPEEEEGYFALMKLYARQNKRDEVKQQYLLLETKLVQELDIPISIEIEDWYNQWVAKLPSP